MSDSAEQYLKSLNQIIRDVESREETITAKDFALWKDTISKLKIAVALIERLSAKGKSESARKIANFFDEVVAVESTMAVPEQSMIKSTAAEDRSFGGIVVMEVQLFFDDFCPQNPDIAGELAAVKALPAFSP